MKPNFSMKYNGVIINSDFKQELELESDVNVIKKIKEYKEYDAIEWVLYFENKSDKNSGIIL